MMYLHTLPHADPGQIADLWRRALGESAWVLTRQEAVDAGWFGPVTDTALPRIGNVIIAARDDIAFFDTRRSGQGVREMVGQHGSLTELERKVPLLELTGRTFDPTTPV
ncbi:hypothetical protein [Nesterenkonia pannonica]|uniref:hypothetical protein n=1 Tax=Nesterenkonia pannonica TaxID=1548602 RepID=UPI00216456FC|nr:hypothetical protein [Nesterenkonia pannonica]